MSLRYSYTLLAPLYDLIVERATRSWRQASLQELSSVQGRVLLAGVGSGLDIPYLPPGSEYTGLDLTHAMLRRARRQARLTRTDITLSQGDVMRLPYPDALFDAVVMHLILAVVPHPARALLEAERVVKAGGRILILDKFLRPGQHAPVRRLLSPLLGMIATRTDVVFEDVLAPCRHLALMSDVTPSGSGGWFRRIVLRKR